jgi:hypothetical protein
MDSDWSFYNRNVWGDHIARLHDRVLAALGGGDG